MHQAMENLKSQVQAMRPVSKDNLDSPTITPAPTVYFDCHSNPATGKSFVLWEDILVVFADALYARHEAKMVPFMKDPEWITYVLRLLLFLHATNKEKNNSCFLPLAIVDQKILIIYLIC